MLAFAPRRIAAIFEGRSTDYATLDRRTSAVANGLIAFGVQPQTRVAYLGKNSDSFFEIYFGAAKVNVVMTPVNWRLAQPELSYILNDSQATVLFITREYVATLEAIPQRVAEPEAGYPARRQARGLSALRDVAVRAEDRRSEAVGRSSDVVIQLYTSGTTGRPKGAELTNGNVLSALEIGRTGALGKWGPDEIGPYPAADVPCRSRAFRIERILSWRVRTSFCERRTRHASWRRFRNGGSPGRIRGLPSSSFASSIPTARPPISARSIQ